MKKKLFTKKLAVYGLATAMVFSLRRCLQSHIGAAYG